MLPHIIESQIADAEAHASGLRATADNCSAEQPALRARLLLSAEATEKVCKLARELGLAAIINRNTIINRRAS